MWSVRQSMFSSRDLVFFLAVLNLITIDGAVIPEEGMATNIQGPRSHSRIVGPDGSVIVADNPGGQIIQQETAGVFEPAGRFLDPQFINPPVPRQLVPKALGTGSFGTSGTVANRPYMAEVDTQHSATDRPSNGFNGAVVVDV